ncbi:PH domain-containing protein [Streptomyces sp. NPDC059752]|uniref:PH domain-containing protein n=1 Tax=unclassified Streptomyces TaxID=2593676 RepID=UPI00364B6388
MTEQLVAAGPSGTARPGGPDGTEVPWERLHPRLIWVNAIRFGLSLVPSLLSIFVFRTEDDLLANWPALIATAIGVITSVGDILRWLRTRYRISDDLVEIRTGRLVRVYRNIPRDRIRTVDLKTRLRHRLAGLRIVHISAGRARPEVKLDAVSKPMALVLQRELMHANDEDGLRETPIAGFRWSWLLYNTVNVSSPFVGTLLLWSLHSMLLVVGLDLVGACRDVIDRVAPDGGPVAWLCWGLLVVVLGLCGLACGFVTQNWGLRLLRVHTGDGSSLLTRRGLLSTREVHRDDSRIRGIQINEPLLTRWMGLTETSLVSTGLATISFTGDPAAGILPRAPLKEVRRVVAQVLPGPVRPLEVPLRRHPPAALVHRLVWALVAPAAACGLLGWLGATGAVPPWAWTVPLWMLPVTVGLAVLAHRALGHTLAGPYLVMRHGLMPRRTVALRTEAVIGLKLRQTLLQRALGLVTVGVPTAAGERFYHAPDMSVDQFIEFADEIVPELTGDFLDRRPMEKENEPR